ncbi:MAG: hypothetical protein ACRECR_02790 [Thermoplasmata archaeon]
MSDGVVELAPDELVGLRVRVLSYYFSVVILGLVGVGILLVYVLSLGTLVGPGVEESFGLAVGALFLIGALLVHVVDRAYREWPLGRRIHPSDPRVITDSNLAATLRIAVFVGGGILIAYILAQLLTS